MTRLAAKRTIVTGGATGIGRAIALRFAAEGARVAVLDLPSRAAEAGEVGLFFPCDVSVAADCSQAVAEAAAAFGGLDVVVNNAGISISGDVETTDEADWDRTFAINVKSVYLISRHAMPHLRAAGGGAIVNIASEAAVMAYAGDAAYCASKAAVVQLTRTMALRHAVDRIRVNAVCPGAIRTEMWDHFIASQPNPAEAEAETLARHPLGFGTPAEVAAMVAYLATDEARYVTGAALMIDGGATCL
jgi:NAD(P)-dependent dehydrogenase (short-subunit alcohol dehydrogenase family)